MWTVVKYHNVNYTNKYHKCEHLSSIIMWILLTSIINVNTVVKCDNVNTTVMYQISTIMLTIIMWTLLSSNINFTTNVKYHNTNTMNKCHKTLLSGINTNVKFHNVNTINKYHKCENLSSIIMWILQTSIINVNSCQIS